MTGNVKPAARRQVIYRDQDGKERTKNCGTSDEEKRCICWIHKKGHELVGKKTIPNN